MSVNEAKTVPMEVKTRVFSRHQQLTLDVPIQISDSEEYKDIIFKSSNENPCIAKVSIFETEDELSLVYTFKK